MKSVWQFILVGIATAGAIIGLDQLLFAGVSRQVIRALGAQPVLVRCAIIVFAAISEELIYRLGVSTLIAWLHSPSRGSDLFKKPSRSGSGLWSLLFYLAYPTSRIFQTRLIDFCGPSASMALLASY